MQKLGFLASILLLASVIIGPIGLSNAQTVDTSKESKMKFDEMKPKMEKEKADRLAAQQQKAADIKAKMLAKKEAAQKDIDAMIAKRNADTKKKDLSYSTADFIAKTREMAKEQIEARKAAGGPSKVQEALNEDRAALEKRIREHKEGIPTTADKDIKSAKEDARKRVKALKGYDASDQLSKEKALKAEEKKAVTKGCDLYKVYTQRCQNLPQKP